MIFLQLMLLIFGLFMIYVLRIHKIKQHIEAFEFSIWLSIWSVFIFLAMFPQTMLGIAQTLNITSVFDLLIILSLMVLAYLTISNRIESKKLEKKLESIVRENAIIDKKKKTSK